MSMEQNQHQGAHNGTSAGAAKRTEDVAVISLKGLLKDKGLVSRMTPVELIEILQQSIKEHHQLVRQVRDDCNHTIGSPTLTLSIRVRPEMESAPEMFWRLRSGAAARFGLKDRCRIDLFLTERPKEIALRDHIAEKAPAMFEQLKVWETVRMSMLFRGRLLSSSYRECLELTGRVDSQKYTLRKDGLKLSMSLLDRYELDRLPAFPFS